MWDGSQLRYPDNGSTPPPNPDLPANIATDYLEARDVFSRSPRSAAALLRLVIQKICIHLGHPGKDLNKDIGALTRQGLLPVVEKSLDAVRVIGNNAVHPGTIDIQDDPSIAASLFDLVNLIVAQMISAPLQAQAAYDRLSPEQLAQISRRNAGAGGSQGGP